MYPKLLTAMKKHRITEKNIAEVLNIPYTTVRDRTKGKYSFSFEQAMKIKKELLPGYKLEELFEPKE